MFCHSIVSHLTSFRLPLAIFSLTSSRHGHMLSSVRQVLAQGWLLMLQLCHCFHNPISFTRLIFFYLRTKLDKHYFTCFLMIVIIIEIHYRSSFRDANPQTRFFTGLISLLCPLVFYARFCMRCSHQHKCVSFSSL